MDLQKALPFTKLTVSEDYYCRSIYSNIVDKTDDMGTSLVYMYVWDETIASRGIKRYLLLIPLLSI